MNQVARIAALVAVVTIFAACAETTVDPDAEPVVVGGGSTPTTTIAITGTAAELLPEMAIEMSRLSAQIADEGGQKETLARIEGIWLVIRPEVESDTPELVLGIDTTVDMARTAVIRIRPADADKGFQLLTGLVDRYTGDG
ncbi:MAG: hypothetical protein DRJ50_06560 [Actinobacteria bacterium]|nr:MAG: hypothetical protein DRJ50_06560 [Actinomycetota bacterium]